MDGFNDAFNNHNGEGEGEAEADPAAEFLAREQSNLAGLEDETITDNTLPVVMNGLDINQGTGHVPYPTSPVPSSFSDIPREEPEKIKRWREDQKKRLENKDLEEEKKKQELRESARKELEEWYTSHEEQVSKNRIINRSAEKELVADSDGSIEPGTEWERIAKLCDFNPKGSKHQKDISRMRSIILQVKQTPPASNFSKK